MLARQLLVGFLGVMLPSTALLAGLTVYSVVRLDRVNRALVEITHAQEAVADLSMALSDAGAPIGAFARTGDPRGRRPFEEAVERAEAKVQSCGSATCHHSGQMPIRLTALIRPPLERLREEGRLLFEDGPGDGARHAEGARQALESLRGAVAPMLGAVRARAEELLRDADAVRLRVWRLTVLFTAAVALAGSGAALVIARRLSRPLTDLVAGTRRLASGDWGYQAAVPASGEMAELRASFNAMVRQLREQREQLEEQNRMLEAGVRQRTDELHRKDEALAQSEKLASLGLLAAGVAHELNNPLTSIVMTTNLLLEEMDATSPLAQDLRRIDAAAGRCRRIIDDLRAFARIRQVERTATAVRTVVDQAVSTSAHELGRPGLTLSCDLPADLPPILWDPGRMVQVLTNLLANAAQAVGAHGRVVVRARRADGWLTLEVEDTGPGIRPADRTRIFDPFFTTKPDGTGLGLSITHGIVGDHGGRIEVVSRTREEAGPDGVTGTIVRVVLPAGDVPA